MRIWLINFKRAWREVVKVLGAIALIKHLLDKIGIVKALSVSDGEFENHKLESRDRSKGAYSAVFRTTLLLIPSLRRAGEAGGKVFIYLCSMNT
ncbi:MAG: hypothetical protein OD815_000941 [Candidatus Alkanophagales archaeon MCA70_species_2]|nr:hypothetical protein [Candidatus Alkanophaga liquidiphilum]